MTSVCNEKKDCSDGSDETEIVCKLYKRKKLYRFEFILENILYGSAYFFILLCLFSTKNY